MKIGTFTEYNGAFTGSIGTLGVHAKIQIVPVDDKPSDLAPDYRIKSGAGEVGAGWKRPRRRGEGHYISIKLDDPSFAAPIYANLVKERDGDAHVLIWSR